MKKHIITSQELGYVKALISEGKFDLPTKNVLAVINLLNSLPEKKDNVEKEDKKLKNK